MWKKQKLDDSKHKSVAEMYPGNNPEYQALTRLPNDQDRANFYGALKAYGRFTGLCWLMSPEPQMQEKLPLPSIQEYLMSPEFLSLSTFENQLASFQDRMKLDMETIQHVASATTGQRENPAWQLLRKGRLTSSNFGYILKSKNVTPSLMKRLLNEYDISSVKSVMWGVTNEAEAIKSFENYSKNKVIQTGLWLDESGVLGASPDGLVGDNYVLEVKCPFKQRDKLLVEALQDKSFCLQRTDNEISLKKDHVYWHQVQGQLHITQRKLCFFVVWTRNWTVTIEIAKDSSWGANILKLKDFYFSHIFKCMLDGQI